MYVQPGDRRVARLSPCRCMPRMDPIWSPPRCWSALPTRPWPATGWLEGWRLTFGGEDLGWEGALATIVEDPGSRVFVVLYDVTSLDEPNLDRWEGGELGIHSKIRLRVQTMDGSVLAWLYVLDAYEGGLPSARYLGVLADAAEAMRRPRRLRRRPPHPPLPRHLRLTHELRPQSRESRLQSRELRL